jgi:bacterioferritin (cytochrome b1)
MGIPVQNPARRDGGHVVEGRPRVASKVSVRGGASVAVRDIEYDVLTVLQSKLEAAAVYDRYLRDADEAGDTGCRNLLEEIKRDDERHAERLRAELKQLVASA